MEKREPPVIFRDAICRRLDWRRRTKPNKPERRSGLFGSVRPMARARAEPARICPDSRRILPNKPERERGGRRPRNRPGPSRQTRGQSAQETTGSWEGKSPAFCIGNRPGNRFGRTSDRPTNGGRSAAEARGEMPRESSGKRGVKSPGPGAETQAWEGLRRGVMLTRWTMPVGRRCVTHWMSNFAASAARPSG